MLREDPSYFQDALKARHEMITFVAEQAHHLQPTKEGILDQACRTTIHDPYKNLIIWDISKIPPDSFWSCSRLLLEL